MFVLIVMAKKVPVVALYMAKNIIIISTEKASLI